MEPRTQQSPAPPSAAAARDGATPAPAAATVCPACGTRNCRPALHYRRFPSFLFPMPEAQARAVETRDLALDVCSSCGHLFQPRPDRELVSLIYGEYYAHYPYDSAESMLGPYRHPFNAMFSMVTGTRLFRSRPRLLEIGCSRPANLQPFAEQGFESIGIDPSPLAASTESVPNVRIISGYYEKTSLEDKVDVVVSRFSLEHILDLPEHVEKMSRDVVEGGLVFVQVPDVAYYVENNQPLFVAHEHIQYFSLRSLSALFGRFGFSPVTCYQRNQPSIIACFESGATGLHLTAGSVADRLGPFVDQVARRRARLTECLRTDERVVLYGCGLTLFWVLSEVELFPRHSITVVDDAPSLTGRYLPAHAIPVEAFGERVFRGAQTVVLTLNPLYHQKVLSRLDGLCLPLRVILLGSDCIEEVFLPRA